MQQVKIITKYLVTKEAIVTFAKDVDIEQVLRTDPELINQEGVSMEIEKDKKIQYIKAVALNGEIIGRFSPIGLGKDLEE